MSNDPSSSDFAERLRRLHLSPTAAVKLFGLGPNGERSVRRMMKGRRQIPPRFEAILSDAEKGNWPDYFDPPPPRKRAPAGER